MQKEKYYSGQDPYLEDYDWAQCSKEESIKERQTDLYTMGVIEGFTISVHAASNDFIDVQYGKGYDAVGERLIIRSGEEFQYNPANPSCYPAKSTGDLGIPLFDYVSGIYNYVWMKHSENYNVNTVSVHPKTGASCYTKDEGGYSIMVDGHAPEVGLNGMSGPWIFLGCVQANGVGGDLTGRINMTERKCFGLEAFGVDIIGSSICATVCVTSPYVYASTCLCGPVVYGTTCITSPTTCGTTIVQSPTVYGSILVCGDTVCGSTIVSGATVYGSILVCGDTVCGSTIVSGATVYGSILVCGATVCGATLTITPGSAVTAVTIDQDYNQASLDINQSSASTADAVIIVNESANVGLRIDQNGVLAANNFGLKVYSDAVQVNSPLVYIKQDNASSTQPALEVWNDGTGKGATIISSNNYGVVSCGGAVGGIYGCGGVGNSVGVYGIVTANCVSSQAYPAGVDGCASGTCGIGVRGCGALQGGFFCGTNDSAGEGVRAHGDAYGVYALAILAGANVYGVYGQGSNGIYGLAEAATGIGVKACNDHANNGSVASYAVTDAADNNYGYNTPDNITAANKAAYISDTFINDEDINLKPGDVVKIHGEPKYFEPYKGPRIPVSGVVLSDTDDDILTLSIVSEPAGPREEMLENEKDFQDNESTEIKPGGRVSVVTTGAFAHCKVDTSFGGIEIGDRLTSSSTKGAARKADVAKDKYIFARSLEKVQANSGIQYISVLVSLR